MPFVEEQLKAARDTLGPDYWSYGVAGNESAIDTFLRHHHSQGLSSRRLSVEEVFHPSTYESFAV
jgi:4,5-dihydroxyphthalate decarboxylase